MVINTDVEKKIWDILESIPDPEIPVINIVELGIVRSIHTISSNEISIVVTPTYSACPAITQIKEDIISIFQQHGWRVIISVELTPVWTTDWMKSSAKEKLKNYGIAPPHKVQSHTQISCPRCLSSQIEKVNEFGSTLCKALYKCNSCLELFDYFKPH